jgi:hypothetical protein
MANEQQGEPTTRTNAPRAREWPNKARGVAEDVLAREITIRAKAREAQQAIINGNAHMAMILLGDIREISLRTSEQLGGALRGEYGE